MHLVAHGSASRRSGRDRRRPQRSHTPYVPASIRARAASIAASSCSALSSSEQLDLAVERLGRARRPGGCSLPSSSTASSSTASVSSTRCGAPRRRRCAPRSGAARGFDVDGHGHGSPPADEYTHALGPQIERSAPARTTSSGGRSAWVSAAATRPATGPASRSSWSRTVCERSPQQRAQPRRKRCSSARRPLDLAAHGLALGVGLVHDLAGAASASRTVVSASRDALRAHLVGGPLGGDERIAQRLLGLVGDAR